MIRFLTEKQAIERAKSVKTGVTYNLYLNLSQGKHYHGLMQIYFEALESKNVFLDFAGKSIEHIEINGKLFANEHVSQIWTNGFVNIPENEVNIGKNTIVIKFSNEYNLDGNGLHTYTDVDGKQYIYCQSEPYWINRVYPVFDQPDIKGFMTYYILAPNDWDIIANENSRIQESAINFANKSHDDDIFVKLIFNQMNQDFQNDTKHMFVFDKTPLLSSYLHAFVGGPYKRIDLEDNEGTVPMAIYCRDSLYKYAHEQKQGIFKFCIEGIKFYNEFFKVPYPFKKYDFVFCPEYTVGAMEYPGVITYNDRFIYREIPNKVQVSALGKVTNHELAHMWFGDLVTMKWWNDLWLNESFADFVCYLCNAIIVDKMPFEISDSWSAFALRKNWGYDEDQMITTHPIACTVEATNQADSIFDGITYSKGASVLKQLYFLIGHEIFSKNISNYFNKYKWGNTTLDNFMDELNNFENQSSHEAYDLAKWQESWIKTAGMNAIEVEWDPTIQGKTQLKIKQTAVSHEHQTLRYHKIEIAFFDENCNTSEVMTVIVENKPETIIEFNNKGYKAVLPNYNDWSFVKIILDPQSLEFISHNLMKLDKTLTQLLVVRSLYEMVKDAKIRGTAFVLNILNGYLPSTLQNIQTFDSIMLFLEKVVFHFMPTQQKFETAHQVFVSLNQILEKTDDFVQKQVLKKKMISFGINDNDIDILRDMLDKIIEYDDKTLNDQNKWSIVYRIAGSKNIDDSTKNGYVDKMLSIDNSDTRKTYMAILDNLRADKQQRDILWAKYIDPALEMSYAELQDHLTGFFSVFVEDGLKLPYSLDTFTRLENICKTRSKEMGNCFLNYCLPERNHIQVTIEQLTILLDKLTDKENYFKIKIRKIIDESQKQLKAFALYQH